jgi:cephalosporin hydroxylase
MDLLGQGEVISVDIDRSKFCVSHPRISLVTGDSASETVVSQVVEKCKGKRVLVLHDGGHDKEQVLKDLAAYAPLVSVGSYLIVEDGIMDVMYPGDGIGTAEPGPLAACEEFLANNPAFVVDESRERYVITYNPKGFLKRVKA